MCTPAVGGYEGVIHECVSLLCVIMLTVIIFVLMVFATTCALAVMIMIYWRIIALIQLVVNQL
jgi:hypothetical protein